MTKTLPCIVHIAPSFWRNTPGGYEANFLLYGQPKGHGEPPEKNLTILQGLRLVNTWPRSPVTLQHVVFKGCYEADPTPGSEGFNDKGELHLSLVHFGILPLLMPGMMVELIFFTTQRPDHPVRIEPMLQPMTPAEVFKWYQDLAITNNVAFQALRPTRTT